MSQTIPFYLLLCIILSHISPIFLPTSFIIFFILRPVFSISHSLLCLTIYFFCQSTVFNNPKQFYLFSFQHEFVITTPAIILVRTDFSDCCTVAIWTFYHFAHTLLNFSITIEIVFYTKEYLNFWQNFT